MAKVEYSALVSQIRGRLSHGVLSNRNMLKVHNAGEHQPLTEKQSRARGYFSNLKGQWFGLSDVQKGLWDSWAASQSKPMTGLNAYVKHNMRLLMAAHADLEEITSPAHTPSTPAHVQGIEAWPDSGQTTIEWTAPLDASNYVQVYFAVQVQYRFRTKAKWSLVETVRSDVGQVIHTHQYPAEFYILYRARSIDAFGRVSPYTHTTAGATQGAHYDEDYYDGGYYV